MSEDVSVVYWSKFSVEERKYRQSLLYEGPEKLIKNLSANKNKENATPYGNCKSFLEMFKNAYILKQPLSVDIDFSKKNENQTHAEWFAFKSPSFNNAITVDYDVAWLFYSEDSIIMEMTPPYLHKYSSISQGYITSGSFDISKWLRPVTLAYQLFPEEKTLTLKAGEPAAYINFKTEKKIVLKEFRINQNILNITEGCSSLKNIIPGLPLKNLYSRFTNGKIGKDIMKEITKNLID